MQATDFGYDLQGIASAIKAKYLRVPVNQRSFAWRDRQVHDLLDDLEKAITAEVGFYYLGAVILRADENGVFEIVDGQQRLTCTVMILSVIRDLLVELGRSEIARDIEDSYLTSADTWTRDIRPRLQLNSVDGEFFQNTVLSSPTDNLRNTSPTIESHGRILRAVEIIRARWRRDIINSSDPLKAIKVRTEFLESNAKALICNFTQATNPFTLFETLNGRGLPLEPPELIKNYLFGLAGNKLDVIQTAWYEIVGTLHALGSDAAEKELETYLRHYWITQYGVVRSEELFPKVRQACKSQDDAIKLGNQLKQSAKVYRRLIAPSSQDWGPSGNKIMPSLMALNTLGMVQSRPLIMAANEKFPVDELLKTLKVMVSMGVRLQVSGRTSRGSVSEAIFVVAHKVTTGQINSASDIAEALRTIVPTDPEFQKAFETASIGTSRIARYMLATLEAFAENSNVPVLVPNPDTDLVNLEHILPRNPSGTWLHFSPDEVTAYKYRIGNLALMKTKLNARGKNEDFDFKRTHYSGQPFTLTSDVAAQSSWTKEQIDIRQRKLAVLALKTWPFR